MVNKSQRTPVKATKTSFQIINTLKRLGSVGVTEISDELDLPNSTVHDHLKTLEEEDYVVNVNGEYRLGTRFLSLGGHVRDQMKLYQVAQSELQTLARDTGEHVNLMIEEHGMGIFLDIVTGDDALYLDTHIGMRVYLHTTALGKAILARLPEDRYEGILEERGLPRITDRTITSKSELDEEMAQIRDRGYAIDDGERIEGVQCVAAPIMGSEGDVLGAVSVSAPKSRMQDKMSEEEIPHRVNRVTNVIQVNATHV